MKLKVLSLLIIPLLVSCNESPTTPGKVKEEITKDEYLTFVNSFTPHQYSYHQFDFVYVSYEDDVPIDDPFKSTDKYEYKNGSWDHIEGTDTPKNINEEYKITTISNAIEEYDLSDYSVIEFKYYKNDYEISLLTQGHDDEDNFDYQSFERHIFNELGYCIYEIYEYTNHYLNDDSTNKMVSEYFYTWR